MIIYCQTMLFILNSSTYNLLNKIPKNKIEEILLSE